MEDVQHNAKPKLVLYNIDEVQAGGDDEGSTEDDEIRLQQ